MGLDQIKDELLEVLEKSAGQHGADVVDVWVTRQGNTPLVQVFVDKADAGPESTPISLDEVAEHTPWISAALDSLDIIDGPYNLEVSSPGMYRPLRKECDFVAYAGERIKLKKKGNSGRLKFTGELLGVEDGSVKLVSDKQEFLVPLTEIEKATVEPKF